MLRNLVLLLAASTVMLAADLTGKWSATVETDAGSGNPTFTFKQAGESLTGTYSGQLGDAPLTGTVKGDEVEFSFQVSPGGDAVKLMYKGKVTGPKEIKGAVDLGGMGSGTFTATKQ